MTGLAISLCVALAIVHLLSGRLTFLSGIPRSKWLSAAGGVSVAYVFVHILPELSEAREHLTQQFSGAWVEQAIFVVALAGMVAFYGLERYARTRHASASAPAVFWVHIGSFAVYNALIGYLLARQEFATAKTLVLFFVAMATHFIVNDHGLRADHSHRYDRQGRWLLAAAILAGFALGSFVEVTRIAHELLFAVLAGGVILNVLKEELPEERESRFGAFAAGVVAYALLLLML